MYSRKPTCARYEMYFLARQILGFNTWLPLKKLSEAQIIATKVFVPSRGTRLWLVATKRSSKWHSAASDHIRVYDGVHAMIPAPLLIRRIDNGHVIVDVPQVNYIRCRCRI